MRFVPRPHLLGMRNPARRANTNDGKPKRQRNQTNCDR